MEGAGIKGSTRRPLGLKMVFPIIVYYSVQKENISSGICEDISRLHSFRVSDLLLAFCLPPDMCGDKMLKEVNN